jgi:heme/copper-type cytochrome/quinol oxidase subunit 2
VLLAMVAASVVAWVGIPVGWLWIGSQIQGNTQDLGLAILVMMSGVIVSVVVIAIGLAWLNRVHFRMLEARGIERQYNPLEAVMIVSALVVVVGFSVWFFGFEGPGPTLAPK